MSMGKMRLAASRKMAKVDGEFDGGKKPDYIRR